jgi:transcriptional regulator with XRE-family HTH domain
MNFRTALGHFLRTERMRQGLTMRALSEKSYVSLGFMSEVERGEKEIASDFLAEWVAALGFQPYEAYLEVAYLMAGEELRVPSTAEELLSLV